MSGDDDATPPGAAQMELGPDAFHEGEAGIYVDCPSCGSPAYLTDVAEVGRCTGYLGEDVDEEEAEDVGGFCQAKLSLELNWWDEP